MRWSFDMDREITIFTGPVGRPHKAVLLECQWRIAPAQRVEGAFRADFDGAFPGLKAWAVLLNRFAVLPDDFSNVQDFVEDPIFDRTPLTGLLVGTYEC
jgi:hypothetical protein